jgi:aminoglycoside 3-N-acetyltransferase
VSERQTIDAVDEPNTVTSLAEQLRDLGIARSEAVIVHTSLSALGWVCGGAQAVVEALRATTGHDQDCTLVMPTFTGQYSDPAGWSNPAVPEAWHEVIREERPAYHPEVTPTRGVGVVPDCFRNYPEVVRSRHPQLSFAARGPAADAIVGGHAFDYALGNTSPLGRLYGRDADVLLLGVEHEANSSLHLAEYRADVTGEPVERSAPVRRDGEREEVAYEDIPLDESDFAELGEDFEREVDVTAGQVGAARAVLCSQPALVDYAVDWFERNR